MTGKWVLDINAMSKNPGQIERYLGKMMEFANYSVMPLVIILEKNEWLPGYIWLSNPGETELFLAEFYKLLGKSTL